MKQLNKYRSKRDFERTPEPPGRERDEGGKPLGFVVHKHRASHLHWDLRLELDGVLKSWAIPKGPSLDPHTKKLAMMVEDHPIDYGTFEGVIPEGNYGAGPVMIWDRGTYHSASAEGRSASEEALRKGLDKGHISFILEGSRLKGEFALVRLRRAKENAWLLIKANDRFADPDATPDADTSVASGRTMAEISHEVPDAADIDMTGAAQAPMPTHVKPMLATLVKEAFDRPGWLFEVKWDGYRAIGEAARGKVRLYSRNDKTLNDHFPPIVDALESLPFTAVLDGEVVVLDTSGKADFQLLQNYLRTKEGTLVYYVFDLLYFNGHNLMKLPLARRKAILRQVLPDLPAVRLSDHVEAEGKGLFEAVKKNDVEGIVAKDGAGPYLPGHRGSGWLKIKTHLRQEAVIGGFTEPRGGRKGFGALVLGVYDGRNLAYIGHTGGGFSDAQLAALHERLKEAEALKSPFDPVPKTNMAVTWVEPKLVAEVRFTEWTNEGLMRHPVFLGLREDQDPHDVRRERPEGDPAGSATAGSATAGSATAGSATAGSATPKTARSPGKARLAIINDERVKLTHLDKVFWPDEGYTKGDVIAYYREIAPFILPYLKDRPESLHRHPDGIRGEGFFQKNVDHEVPDWVRTVRITSETDGRDVTYLVCQDEATLVYMANLGCIEINPWSSRVGRLDNPDFMVLDIDPLDVPFTEVVRTANVTRNVLTEIGAHGYCKTSGATGLHIYVPVGARYSYDEVTQFARLVNVLVHTRLPDTTSVERNPKKRAGKVYLDFLQNGRNQTLAAPYCIRPRQRATVSTPLRWEEVTARLDPGRFTMKTILKRLHAVGDLWKDVLGPGIDIERCLVRLETLLKG